MQTQSLRKIAWPTSIQIPAAWKWCLPVWLISRLFLWAWGCILWFLHIIPLQPAHTFYFEVQPALSGWSAPLLWVWFRWDAINYLRIAESGYHAEDLSAFFPLYPLLGRWLSSILGGSAPAALLLLSNLAFLCVLVLLYEIVEKDHGAFLAQQAVVTAVLFPASFFFATPYPHSLAVLLTLGAYFCARRSWWLGAALLGLLGGLSHSTILPLVLLLGFLVWKELRPKLISLRSVLWLVPCTPMLGYAAFMAWRYQEGFPSHPSLMYMDWGVYITPPWKAVLEIPLLIKSPYFPSIGWVNILVFFLAAAFTIRFFKKIPMESWIYQASLLLLLLSLTTKGGPLYGLTRYVVAMFPLYVEIAIWASTKWRRRFRMAIGIALQIYLTSLYLLWAWVA